MDKIMCGIVTYFPTTIDISKIEEYCECFDEVYVYDNTPGGACKKLFKKIKSDNFHFVSNKKNDGLSKAYNFFIDKAENNFAYLCTMDQDSVFDKQNIKNMRKFLRKTINQKNAVIGPHVIYNYTPKRISYSKTVEKKFVISSGSFINLNLIKERNIRFDENYFIDRVDLDFCTECIRNGLKVIEYNDSELFQKLGNGKKSAQHSVKRHYYIFRNRFYYNRKFLRNYIVYDFLQTIKQISRIIIFEDQKIQKIGQFFPALYDYKKCCMGKGRY